MLYGLLDCRCRTARRRDHLLKAAQKRRREKRRSSIDRLHLGVPENTASYKLPDGREVASLVREGPTRRTTSTRPGLGAIETDSDRAASGRSGHSVTIGDGRPSERPNTPQETVIRIL